MNDTGSPILPGVAGVHVDGELAGRAAVPGRAHLDLALGPREERTIELRHEVRSPPRAASLAGLE